MILADQVTKELWVVGGPNGAGKTTWVRRARQVHEDVLYLSADQIASELSPAKPENAAIGAGREFLRQLRAAIEAGRELIVESTLSGRGMARFLELARNEGYRIVIVFIFLHRADLCVRRVEARVQSGGHHVPEADILRRYGRSKTNFWTLYRPLADEWHLYFNGGDSFEMVASGDAETTVVHNEARHGLFRDTGRS
jgi:predicted ABC-type ATPase